MIACTAAALKKWCEGVSSAFVPASPVREVFFASWPAPPWLMPLVRLRARGSARPSAGLPLSESPEGPSRL